MENTVRKQVETSPFTHKQSSTWTDLIAGVPLWTRKNFITRERRACKVLRTAAATMASENENKHEVTVDMIRPVV